MATTSQTPELAPFAPSTARKEGLFGASRPPATPSQLKDLMSEKTVTMFFPQPVVLTLSGPLKFKRVRFGVGVQEVPESLADHAYLKAHGAQRHTAGKQPDPPPPVTDDHTKVDLNKLTKAELMTHAEEHHDLTLDPQDKKEDMIAAIELEREKK
jgi:hypothetical protein